MAKTWHRSLVGRSVRKAFVTDKGLAHTKKICHQNRYLEYKKDFENIELPTKLIDYF